MPRSSSESATALAGEQEGNGPEDTDNEDDTDDKEQLYKTNRGISIMLLGSIAFIMGLFYIVNHKDPEFREYSWDVLSATISIFSAVLIFQGINGVIEEFVLEGADAKKKIIVGLGQVMFWYLFLQVFLAVVSGAVSCSCGKRKKTEGEYNEMQDAEEEKEELESIELNLKCFAVLLGHITGFAAIGGWGQIQQLFKDSLGYTALCILAPIVAFTLLFLIMDCVRRKVALSDDGKEDEKEKLWDEETEETENDIMGLAVSFLTVQWIRFAIGGFLPDAEGQEHPMGRHPYWQSAALLGCGFVFCLLLVVRTAAARSLGRFTAIVQCVVSMVFAWCIMFSGEWFINRILVNQVGIMKEVTLSLTVSSMALTCIFFLDRIADMDCTGANVDKALRTIVIALGILIGFTWEKSFDTAVEEVSELNPIEWMPRSVLKMLMSFALAATVIPAWRWYILPTVLEFKAGEEEEGEGEQEEKPEHGHEEKKEANAFNDKELVGLNLGALKRRMRRTKLDLRKLEKEKRQHEWSHPSQAQRIQDLQKRNKDLESAIKSFSKEIGELQNLADILIK